MIASPKIDLKNLDKSEWKTYRFDEIAKHISERVDPNNTDLTTYIGLEHIDPESLHIRRFGSPDDVNGTKLKFYKGDIIFGRRRAYQRKAGIAKMDGFCSAHALVLRANPEVIDARLFPFFLHSDLFMNRAVDISVGSLSPTINWGALKHQQFRLPPQNMQTKFAKLLLSSDNYIEKMKMLLVQEERLRDTSREKLYTYGTQALSGNLNPSLKLGKCGLVREDWDIKNFLDCAEIISGQVDPKDDNYCDLYQIGSERIEANTGRILELKSAKELNIKSGNYLFLDTDIIYSKIRPYFKKVANPNFRGLCSADIYPLRPNTNVVSKDYLFYYMLTEMFTRRLLRFQNRTGMPKVNRDELGAMYVPVPTKTEQDKVVNILEQIDQSNDTIRAKIDSATDVFRSLIHEVF